MSTKLFMPMAPVASAPMPTGVQQQTAAPIGIIITDPGNLQTHGVNSDHEKQRLGGRDGTICGFFNTSWAARMVVEFAATFGLYFLLSVARVLNPQGFFFYSPFNIGFVALATVFISVILFNYATGVTMSGTGSFVVVLSNWVIRGIRSDSKEETHGDAHDLLPIQYWYDVGRLLSMWFVQILGGYAGVLLAIVVFLQGATNEFYDIAEKMTPNFGLATWLPGPVLVTSWQASSMIFVGAFVVHAALLYTYCVDKLYKKSIWAGFVRGGAHFVALVLFYTQTGGAFDLFSWLIPASLNMNFAGTHKTQDELFAYLLAPVAGALAAVLFVWLWIWISQATELKTNINNQKKASRATKEEKLRRIVREANESKAGYSSVPLEEERATEANGAGMESNPEQGMGEPNKAYVDAGLPRIVLGQGISRRY